MNILHICSPHLSDVASSHFNLGNPKKSFFSTVSFVHTSDLPFLRRKQIATAALQLSCLLYCLPIICTSLLPRLGHATWGAHVSSISPRYGRATTAAFATWADFSTAWCMMVNKDWGMYPCWRWPLWTLALTLFVCCQLPHITTGSSQSHQHHLKEHNKPSVTQKKVLHFTS